MHVECHGIRGGLGELFHLSVMGRVLASFDLGFGFVSQPPRLNARNLGISTKRQCVSFSSKVVTCILDRLGLISKYRLKLSLKFQSEIRRFDVLDLHINEHFTVSILWHGKDTSESTNNFTGYKRTKTDARERI